MAVPIAPELRDAPAKVRAVLGAAAAALRWLEGDGLHLTLRFLGEIAADEVERVAEAARAAARSAAPFSITLAGAGAFPSLREPRVLWVAVADGGERLSGLARALEAALAAGGFRPDARPFHPHVTVARARSDGRLPDLRDLAPRLGGAEGPVIGVQPVDAISVVESTLHPRGPTYREVSRAALGER